MISCKACGWPWSVIQNDKFRITIKQDRDDIHRTPKNLSRPSRHRPLNLKQVPCPFTQFDETVPSEPDTRNC
jgi:hypothetical protein